MQILRSFSHGWVACYACKTLEKESFKKHRRFCCCLCFGAEEMTRFEMAIYPRMVFWQRHKLLLWWESYVEFHGFSCSYAKELYLKCRSFAKSEIKCFVPA